MGGVISYCFNDILEENKMLRTKVNLLNSEIDLNKADIYNANEKTASEKLSNFKLKDNNDKLNILHKNDQCIISLYNNTIRDFTKVKNKMYKNSLIENEKNADAYILCVLNSIQAIVEEHYDNLESYNNNMNTYNGNSVIIDICGYSDKINNKPTNSNSTNGKTNKSKTNKSKTNKSLNLSVYRTEDEQNNLNKTEMFEIIKKNEFLDM